LSDDRAVCDIVITGFVSDSGGIVKVYTSVLYCKALWVLRAESWNYRIHRSLHPARDSYTISVTINAFVDTRNISSAV